MSYATHIGLGSDEKKQQIKDAKETSKRQALDAAMEKAGIKATAATHVAEMKIRAKKGEAGVVVYNPPSAAGQFITLEEARALYDEKWAEAAGRPVPGGAAATASIQSRVAGGDDGKQMMLVAGGLLAVAAGIWYIKKRRA